MDGLWAEERSDVLVSQLVFGDAHELAGGGGGFEAGDGGEFVVVDLDGGCVLGCFWVATMVWRKEWKVRLRTFGSVSKHCHCCCELAG